MRFRAVLPLVADNLRRNRLFFVFSLFGVACGVAVLLFFTGLGVGVKTRIVDTLFAQLPETRLKIISPRVDLGLLNLVKKDLVKGKALSQSLLDDLRGTEGVLSVYGEMNVDFPIKAQGSLLGFSMVTDLVAAGVDPEVVAADLPAPERFVGGKPLVPVVISRQLLDIFNTSYGPMNNMPQLSESAVIGFKFELVLGRSYLGGSAEQGKIRRVKCEVVGFSTKAVLMGVTLPIEDVRRWNAEFGGGGEEYHALYVDARSPQRVEELKERLKGLGYEVQTAKEGASQKVAQMVLFVTGLFSVISGVIMVLSAGTLSFLLFLMVQRRTREIGIWRTVGATRREMALMVLLEGWMVGLCGWVVGSLMGWGAASLFDFIASEQSLGLPFVPASFFDFPLWLWGASLVYALGFTLLGALFPALHAARLDPLKAIRGG